jgi:hypothetical protein
LILGVGEMAGGFRNFKNLFHCLNSCLFNRNDTANG